MSADAHDSHDAEPGHGPTKATFVTVFLVLTFLTVVEVMVPQVYSAEWNKNTKMILLVTLAVGKAILVASYFMHLKWEARWIRWIAAMPVYMGLFAILLMCEQAWRNGIS
jgi:cytochrome c oxidase subunit 4